jgi:hypothetical protein
MAPNSPFLEQMERVKRRGQQRWRRPDGERYYTWDPLHGEIEVWNKRGWHLGAADPVTGELIKDARMGRSIDV